MLHLYKSLQCNCAYLLAHINNVQPLLRLQLIISRQDSEIGYMVFKIQNLKGFTWKWSPQMDMNNKLEEKFDQIKKDEALRITVGK